MSTPLRVLTVGNMYPPHHLGGAELVWRSSVEQMREELGWTVRVLTSDWRSPSPGASSSEEADVHRELPWYWRDHGFPRYGARERLALERRARATFRRHLRDLAPDVVVWWSMGGMPLSLLELPGEAAVPAAGVLLDDWLGYGPAVDGWQRLCHRLGPAGRALAAATGIPARIDLGAAAEWIFMSETVRRRAAEAGVDVSGSHVAYRGVDASRFAARPARKGWEGELLLLGRIDPRKGIGVALRALALEPLAGCRLRVDGGGDSAHLADLERLAAELGIADRVRFDRSSSERVPELLAEADALLFPVQWEEPWGLVPLEAMAAGTPVVASGTGGSGEYLADGENALVYAPRDSPAALAAAVARLAGDAGLRLRLRAGGLETVARFSEAGFNERVAAIVARVAARDDMRESAGESR